MCHFELMANELGFTGKWTDDLSWAEKGKEQEYIISYDIAE